MMEHRTIYVYGNQCIYAYLHLLLIWILNAQVRFLEQRRLVIYFTASNNHVVPLCSSHHSWSNKARAGWTKLHIESVL